MKSIFNSVGSNYTFSFAMQSLFAFGNKNTTESLKKYLSKKYGGEPTLFYKGRNAIDYALRISGIAHGKGVVICAYTCAVVPTAVKNAGYTPIYADINEKSLDFSFETFKNIYEKNGNIGAVIIQNTLGFTNDIKEFESFCRQNNIVLIEDLAHSAGANYPDGREVGTVGDYTVLSFSQDKIIDAVSGGALIVRTPNAMKAEINWKKVPFTVQFRDRFYPIFTWKVRNFYNIGIGRAIHYIFRKFKLLSVPLYSIEHTDFEILPDWYTRLVLNRFKNLESDILRRRMCAREYLKILPSELHCVVNEESIARATCLRIPLLVNDRNNLVAYFKVHRTYISDIWYDVPVSPKRYWHLFENENTEPVTRSVSSRMINFPTHMTLLSNDIERISERFQKWKK
ncbi:MAG: aminotransferase class I/II-fold pyridoxal phosphate-dependent enzyme [Candidatus Pacebacteria bacterium]|nr:aminotransferase class I/II-fold pyridoxal phosphate-dependent enzyme [Candidatus Paceibacterota bacterium]